MSSNFKQVKKGSVAKFKDFYNNIVRKPLSQEDREELRDAFKKKDKKEQPENIKPRKIAKPDHDLGI